MKKTTSITTKKGDQGTSRLFSGEEVPKNSLRLETYGDIDELVSVLGIARFHAQDKETREALLFIQRALFTVSSELATSPQKLNRLKRRVDQPMLDELEKKREALEKRIQLPKGFVIPGNYLAAAHIEQARTVTRRCERKVVGLFQANLISNKIMMIWFNRLSDYLYLLARNEEDEPTLA